jgi:branched-chain amino acid transport system permease protein
MYLPCGTFSGSYAEDMAVLRTREHWTLVAIGVAATLGAALTLNNYLLSVLNLIAISIIAALGLQLLTGFTGQFSVAHSAFMAVGAYTSAILAVRGVSFWLSLPAGVLVAGLIGIVFGLPAVRIKGFYLLMATFAAQFILMYVIRQWEGLTKGEYGHPAPSPSIAGFVIRSDREFFVLIIIILVAATCLAKNLARSKAGRAFVAIRDNDLAAEVMGINVARYKLLAFFVACAYAGAAGALYAHWNRTITPEPFSVIVSVWYLGYLLVGGLGSIPGTFFGVTFIVGLTEGLTYLFSWLSSVCPRADALIAPGRNVVFGLVVALFLIFEPRGLVHAWEKLKMYYRSWPLPHYRG